MHIVPFTDLQLAIYDHCDESYAITIMRRMMYRIAERLAKKQNALAIVNGESIGQVASQTLESMQTINDVTRMPIIRPLACMDKVEISTWHARSAHMRRASSPGRTAARSLRRRTR